MVGVSLVDLLVVSFVSFVVIVVTPSVNVSSIAVAFFALGGIPAVIWTTFTWRRNVSAGVSSVRRGRRRRR